MVWDETARVMSELVNDVWGTSQEVTVDHATTLTLPARSSSFESYD